MKLRLFGTFEASAGDCPLQIAKPHAGAMVIAYVLLHGGGPIERLRLVRALWPDDDESEARARLRRRLHALATEFDSVEASRNWLQVSASRVSLSPQAQEVCDVIAFQRQLDAGDVDGALRHYTGDLLPDWDEEWVIAERERLRARALSALESACDDKQRAGDYDAAIAYARRAQVIDPWREQTVRTLMGLYYVSGDRTAALHVYEQFARTIGDELGVAPMLETQSVYSGIRNASATKVKAASATPLDLTFLGRDPEMAALHDAAKNATEGRGSLILLSGLSGIGKTRLLREFAANVASLDFRMCAGATSSIEAYPYEAIIEAFRSCGPVLGAIPLREHLRGVLGPAFPEFASSGAAAEPGSPAPEDIALLHEAFNAIVAALSDARPLLLLLDDLHYAGPATIALLRAIARNVGERRVLIVAAFRDDDLKRSRPLRALARYLADDVAIRRVRLGPLQDNVVRVIAERALESVVHDGVAERLVERSGGNPLFLRELLRRAGDHGTLSISRLAELPPAIGAFILSGLADLDQRDRDILDLASVVGSSFDADMLAEASGLAETVAYDRLEYLVERGLLCAVGARGRGDYTFAHQSIAEALYLELDAVRRVRTHGRVARALIDTVEDSPQPPFYEIAYHLEHSDDAEAGLWYVRAAQQALSAYALDDAERFASIGLRTATPDVRFSALLIADDIARLRGDSHTRAGILNQLSSLVPSVSIDGANELIALRRVEAAMQAADLGAEELAISELQRIPATDESRRNFDIARFKARQALRLGRLGEARHAVADALDWIVAARATLAEEANIHVLAGQIASQQGDVAEADARLAHAKAVARTSDDPALLARIFRGEQEIRFAQLRFEESVEAGEAALRIATAMGDMAIAAEAHARNAPALARLFLVDRAREHFAQARHFYRKTSNAQGLAAIAINEAVFLMHLGRVEEASVTCDLAYELFGKLRDLRGRTIALLNRTVIDVRRNALDSAAAAAKQALRLSRFIKSAPLEAHGLANLGAVERRLGRLQPAIAHLRAAVALHRSLGAEVPLVTHLTELTQALVCAGDRNEAVALCDELVTVVDETLVGAKDPQFALWSVAQSLRALGDRDGSARALERAASTLRKRASAIPDVSSRDAFLTFADNPAILAAAERGTWPPIGSF